MPIRFDNKGNPHPYSVIAIDMVKFEQIFATIPDVNRRGWLLQQLKQYIEDFSNSITPNIWFQWFGGSYTSTKLSPSDIDLVNFIDPSSAEMALQHIGAFITDNKNNIDSKKTYSIDGYLVPLFEKNDPRYKITVDLCNYWQKWFGHDRDQNPKAVVKVIQKC